MSRRNQILSTISLSVTVLLAWFFYPKTLQSNFDLIPYPNFALFPHPNPVQISPSVVNDDGLEYMIGIELGENSRAGFYDREGLHVFTNDQGRNFTTSCVNDSCIKRPEFDLNIASNIIKQLKADAERFFSRQIREAVIAVPAYFNDTQRKLIKDLAAITGLSFSRIVNEPTAAAIAYKLDKEEALEMNFIVYNLNSNSFDVTVENVEAGVFEIMAYASGSIGSDHFEQAMLECTTCTPETQPLEAYKKVFDKIQPVIEHVLEEGKLEKNQVEGIILTGAPQHIAKVQPFIEQYFGKKVYEGIRSDEAILQGVAHQGYILGVGEAMDYISVIDIIPLSIGIDLDGIFSKVIPRNNIVPTRKSITVTTVKDNQPTIKLNILEGARPISSKNCQLGTLEIPVHPALAGIPRIDVTFELDLNGLFLVIARDRAEEDEESHVVAEAVFRYTQDDVYDLMVDAEINHMVDLAAKQAIEKKNIKPSFKRLAGYGNVPPVVPPAM